MFSKADAYEHYMGRWSHSLAPALVAFAEVHDGDVVLDVGSGTGVLSFAVRDVTKTSRITGIDLSADYVVALPKDRQAALERRLRKRLLGDGPDRPIDLHGRVWAVKGTTPR